MSEGEEDAFTPPVEPWLLQDALRGLPSFSRELIAGGVAGGLSKTCVAPLERAKILMQTRGGAEASSLVSTLRFMWRNERVPGLFKGNTASVLRIVPYAAVHFASYEWFRRVLHESAAGSSGGGGGSSGPSSSGGDGSAASRGGGDASTSGSSGGGSGGGGGQPRSAPVWDLLAGAASGAVAVVATYPLDLVRTRMAYTTEGLTEQTRIAPALSACLRDGGVPGLYRGAAPTLLGILPYAGLKFYFYAACKDLYQEHWAAGPGEAPGGGSGNGRLPTGAMLMAGGISGLAAQTLTYPLDVIRRQMQVAGLPGAPGAAGGGGGSGAMSSVASSSGGGGGGAAQRATIAGTARHIWAEAGARGFFRGLMTNFVKVVPSTAIGFTAYDHLKSYLGLHAP